MWNKNGGLSVLGTIVLVLVILKLFGLISLGWLWILMPIWIPVMFFLLMLVGLLCFYLLIPK